MPVIHPNMVLSALAEVEGDAFERFFKEFGAVVFGQSFSPVGGRHDGGADGFANEPIYEGTRRLTYYQASVQADHRGKIKQTIARLREYGRDVSSLNYVTSRVVKDLDHEELELSNLLNVNITIHDGQWIANRINTNEATQAAFENHLRFYVGLSAQERKNSSISVPSEFNVNAAVFVTQQTMLYDPKADLRATVLDSVALFALEQAALEGEPFITSIEVHSRIARDFPKGFNFSDQEVRERLALLSTRDHPNGKQLVWDDREGAYSLPFAARSAIAEQHAQFEALIYRVHEEFKSKILAYLSDNEEMGEKLSQLTEVAISSLEGLFMEEGLRIAQFLDGAEEDLAEHTVQDVVVASLRKAGLAGKHAPQFVEAVMKSLRDALYEPSIDQKSYLTYLARTYALLFSMKYDLKLASYFADLNASFRLVVGADVIIQALSENRLPEDSRTFQGLLKMLRISGADLILTDYAVDEVYTHIVAANAEYANHYASQDQYMTLNLARNSDRILIRAYYYAKLAPVGARGGVRNWAEFIEQFLPYAQIRTAEARLALRSYLREKFSLRLETKSEVDAAISVRDQAQIAEQLLLSRVKDRRELAMNDAANILLVYALRSESREVARSSPVGYRTWWLTSETKVQSALQKLIKEGGKAIMRPQIAAQLLAFAPSTEEVKEAYAQFMPSLISVRLGNRSHPSVLRKMLDHVADIIQRDPARLQAEMERMANRMKSEERSALEAALE